jgi:ABC-type molybdate transport system ATPase subunit
MLCLSVPSGRGFFSTTQPDLLLLDDPTNYLDLEGTL